MRVLIISLLSLCFSFVACNSFDVDRSKQDLTEYDLDKFDYFDETPEGISLRSGVSKLDRSAALGRLLFYDTQLSRNNNISCASCHKQAFAFGESKEKSEGLFNDQLSRNANALTYAGFRGRLFWDGRTNRLNSAVLEPIVNHSEMAMSSIDDLSAKLLQSDLYVDLFNRTYGTGPTETNIGRTLASFIGSMYSFISKFDEGVDVDFINFTESELRGHELFTGRANCDKCHQGINFDSYYNTANIGLDLNPNDQGSGDGKFRVPSLRNIDQSAPYMHDGRFATLEEVIEHYNSGVQDHPQLEWWLKDSDSKPLKLNLTEQEKEDLLAFLMTLSDHTLVYDERFSNPF